MDTFDHVLNWKLKKGSHPFPGSDGGTCINEAALVAAGFPYKPIRIVEQMPKCFSRPICSLAMALNDLANDEDRQRLLLFVTRLACADALEVEHMRMIYIFECTRNYVYRVPFEKGLEVLEGALAIGRQADPLGPDEFLPRLEAVRARGLKPKAASDKPFFSKVKSWLTMKETEPAA